MAFDYSPVSLSLKVAGVSTVIVTVLGIALAWLMKTYAFRGKHFFETFIGLPIVLPPTVIGFGLLLLLGKNGIFDGFQLLFTWWAAVIAAIVVSLPLMYRSVSASFATVDIKMEQAARTLGASELRIFYKITLPLALPGIITGVVIAFARALGEFGATLMIAGNIPGITQTIPLAIFFAVESGDMTTAGYLVAIIVLISFCMTYGINKWFEGRGYHHADSGLQKNFT